MSDAADGGGALRVAVLASGNGTNLQALLDGPHAAGTAEVVGVASDKAGARALERAAGAGVATAVFPRADYADREERDLAIAAWLDELGAELVVLAGYMQLLSGAFIRRFPARIINVHPALLPSFPGLDAIGQAYAHGVRVTGVTVHFVDEGVDTGPILLQRAVEIRGGQSREQLEDEIHAVEHELLPHAVELFARGAVAVDPANPRSVRIDQPG